jgi:hypothetical protein
MELTDLATQKFDIGRVALFGVPGGWDGTTPLFAAGGPLVHYGVVDGPVDPSTNPEYSELTIETTGPAALKRYLTGERPEFEISVYPNPENLRVFTPTGRGSAGQMRRRLVREHTLWLVPEELFLKADADGNMTEVVVAYDGAAWTKDDEALTAEETELLDMSMVIWRADFGRLTPIFQHEDGGKALKSVPVTVQQDITMPDGCQLYLVLGELSDFPDLDLHPAEES